MTQQQNQKPETTTDATGKSSITGGQKAANSGANANPARPTSEADAQPKSGESKPATDNSKAAANSCATGSDKKSAA